MEEEIKHILSTKYNVRYKQSVGEHSLKKFMIYSNIIFETRKR